MEIKKFDKNKDYEILLSWFNQWGWKSWPIETISNNAYLVYNNNKPIAFSFYASSDTSIAWLGFVITDRESSKEDKHNAINILINYIFKEAENAGFHSIVYYTDGFNKTKNKSTYRNPIIKFVTDCGMQQIDRGNAYVFMKSLNGKDISHFYE